MRDWIRGIKMSEYLEDSSKRASGRIFEKIAELRVENLVSFVDHKYGMTDEKRFDCKVRVERGQFQEEFLNSSDEFSA